MLSPVEVSVFWLRVPHEESCTLDGSSAMNPCLTDDLANHISMNVGQAAVDAVVAHGESFVVDS